MNDKFTPIHNEILEALCKINLSSYETRVLLAILRKTYGFIDKETGERKKTDFISVSQISRMTTLDKRYASRSLKSLKEKKVICRDDKKTGFSKEFMKLLSSVEGKGVSPVEMTNNDKVSPVEGKGIPCRDDKVSPVEAPQIERKKYNKYNIEIEDFSKEVIRVFNDTFKKNFRVFPPNAYSGLSYWLTVYSEEEILQAIRNSIYEPYWKDKIDQPIWYFRRTNPKNEPVDYIGKMLNVKPPHVQTSEEYWLEASNEMRAKEGVPPLKTLYDKSI